MGKSYKKTPIGGNTTAESEKQFKRRANRRLRRAVHAILAEMCFLKIDDLEEKPVEERLPLLREVSNTWAEGDKDGKSYWHEDTPFREHLCRK